MRIAGASSTKVAARADASGTKDAVRPDASTTKDAALADVQALSTPSGLTFGH